MLKIEEKNETIHRERVSSIVSSLSVAIVLFFLLIGSASAAPWASGSSLDTNKTSYWNLTSNTAETGGITLSKPASNPAPTNVTGLWNNASRFYGPNGNNTLGQYWWVNKSIISSGTAAQSYSALVRLSTNFSLASGANGFIFMKDDGTGGKVEYDIYIQNTSGTLNIFFDRTKPAVVSNYCTYAFGTRINSSAFSLVSMAYDGARIYGYINGVNVCNVASTGTSTYGTNCFALGTFANTNPNGGNCSDTGNQNSSLGSFDIDEVGIWSRNLTVTDMAVLWSNYTQAQGGASSSCTYSGSGNWLIQNSDNCNITTNYNLGGKNLTLNGTTGTTQFKSNITGVGFFTLLGKWVLWASQGARITS